jgi:hypothetical protein
VTITPPKLPPLYPKQERAIFAPERYAVIEASTKVGKTAGCLIWLYVQAWNKGKPGRNYWWVAPIFPQAKIAFNRLKRMLTGSDPDRISWKYNETELWIEFVSGGRIWFKSADHPDALFAEDVYGVVVDEATRCKDESWYAIRTTLTSTNGPARIIGNVRGRKNWAYRMARKAEAGAEGFFYAKLTAWDAVEGGILDREEIESAQRDLPEHVFRELYLAEPADDGGNPFGLDAIRACIAPLSTSPVVAIGVDLAKSQDWTVIAGIDEQGRTCKLERFQSDWGQTTRRVADAIGKTPAFIDSTGVGDPIAENLCRACPHAEGYKFTSTSKQQIMEGLAAAIQQRRITFPDGWLVNELETFEYEYTAGNTRYSAPEGLHDDGVCALALAVHCRAYNRPVKVIGGNVIRCGMR